MINTSDLRAALRFMSTVSLICVATAAAAQDAPGSRTVQDFTPVTDEYLLNPSPNDWMMMRGNYEAWGYSQLDEINRDNVRGLSLVWARAMGDGNNQGAPLVYNGVMYLPNPWDTIQAIDAATGDLIWEYNRGGVQTVDWDAGPVRSSIADRSRSLFLHDDKIYAGTHDNYIIALDARTGQLVWETDRGGEGLTVNSNGPIVVNGVVVAGSSCQHAGYGCYVTGHDAVSGEELWRNEFIPRPGEPGDETWGGTSFESRWCTGAWGQLVYDPEADLVHYGSTGICPASEAVRGQPGATMAGTNTRFAVRPQTGEIVWEHQVLPRDNWDQECTFEMMVIDTLVNPNPDALGMLAVNADVAGQTRRTLTGMPCKTPVFWSFDAETGEFIYAKSTWDEAQSIYESIDSEGNVVINEAAVLADVNEEYFWCPTFSGGRDFPSGAYDPNLNVMFMPTSDLCAFTQARTDREAAPAFAYNVTNRGVVNPAKDNDLVGRLDAVDVETGETIWTWETRARNYSPILATAGGLVFNGGLDRYFRAHDSETGDLLWQTRLGSTGSGYTVTYSVDGKQYIATVSGQGIVGPGQTPEIDHVNSGNMVYVFALDDE